MTISLHCLKPPLLPSDEWDKAFLCQRTVFLGNEEASTKERGTYTYSFAKMISVLNNGSAIMS
jgi:hypothetical protein